MIKSWILTLALGCVTMSDFTQQRATLDRVHTPKSGSAEEQSILNALHNKLFSHFKVNYLKVHHGWAWTDMKPLDSHGKALAEGGPELLHRKAGKWTVLDLSKVPADPNDPLGAVDASAVFVKQVRQKFRGVPADIFPEPGC